MRRRDFVTFLIGVTAWVAEAGSQEQRHVIGYLGFQLPTISSSGV
jgi:hypothetical protein